MDGMGGSSPLKYISVCPSTDPKYDIVLILDLIVVLDGVMVLLAMYTLNFGMSPFDVTYFGLLNCIIFSTAHPGLLLGHRRPTRANTNAAIPMRTTASNGTLV